ncbi:MAG: hypothetical protein ACOY94_10220 [Bacillota bacterium]
MAGTGPKGKGVEGAPNVQELVAAGQLAAKEVAGRSTFFDLSVAPKVTRNMVGPQFSIPHRGYVGKGSTKAIEAIREAVKARRMTSPTPGALEIHFDEAEPTVIYGVPRAKQSPSYMALDWSEQGRVVRANFQAILQAKEVEIAQGLRLVLQVEHVKHAELGHCVKLSWDNRSFVPMSESAEEEQQG